MTNRIKIGILINSRLILGLWEILKHKLSKKYILDVHEISMSSDEQKLKKSLIKNFDTNYDAIIGDFLITSDMYSKVNFSFPIYFITPRIIFLPKKKDVNYLLYIKYLIYGWVKPIMALIVIGFFLGLILSRSDNRGIIRGIYHTISAFLGEASNLVGNTNTKNILSLFLTVIILIFVYLFTIYFTSITVVRSISYFNKSDKLENNVKGSKIFIHTKMTGEGISSKSLKRLGGIPVSIDIPEYDSENLVKYYKKNVDKASGIIVTGKNLLKLSDDNSLELSKLELTSSLPIAFPVSKKKPKLLYDINILLINMKANGSLEELCNKHINPLDSSTYC